MLDAKGEASVKLPAWFDVLNRDFRYQLTPIGAPAPGLYIARGIAENSFQIAGGKPKMRVSWQVTGIRKDQWAKKNPLVVEERKSGKERGHEMDAKPDAQRPDITELMRKAVKLAKRKQAGPAPLPIKVPLSAKGRKQKPSRVFR